MGGGVESLALSTSDIWKNVGRTLDFGTYNHDTYGSDDCVKDILLNKAPIVGDFTYFGNFICAVSYSMVLQGTRDRLYNSAIVFTYGNAIGDKVVFYRNSNGTIKKTIFNGTTTTI